MEEEIPFNYFHQLFLQNIQKKKIELARDRIAQDEEDDLISLLLFTEFTKEEMLSISNEVLMDICENYMITTQSEIEVLPNDPFSFINLILNKEEENTYRNSFLESLPLIYREYFSVLGNGIPYLMGSTDEKKPSCFTINLDHQYRIINFDITNMDLLEQVKTMTKIVSMEVGERIGPVPKVLILINPDPTLNVITE